MNIEPSNANDIEDAILGFVSDLTGLSADQARQYARPIALALHDAGYKKVRK